MNINQIDSNSKTDRDIDAEEALKIAKFLQQEITDNLQQLSLEGLRAISEFSAYLVYKENLEATEEIENIPDIKQKLQEAEAEVTEEKLIDWNELKDEL